MKKDVKLNFNEEHRYERIYPKISAYTYCFNAKIINAPYIESIKSVLPIVDECIVLDGESNDGTYEELQKLAEENSKIQLFQNAFDLTEPGIDGQMKAFARALCSGEILIQFDVDEFFHESDVEKFKMIAKKFPKHCDILHMPIVELWGPNGEVTGRRHAWKWRLSRNKPEITHGINKFAKLIDEKTGKTFAKKGQSDGCEYVNVLTAEPLPHIGFYTAELEQIRQQQPEKYGLILNEVANTIPAIYHTSWFNLQNKIKQLRKGGVWDKMWCLLYQCESEDRFPNCNTDEEVNSIAQKLYEQGGEDTDKIKYKFKLDKPLPKLLQEWAEKK
jgi:glycosyltransferase involved in cell wall biosynthesis